MDYLELIIMNNNMMNSLKIVYKTIYGRLMNTLSICSIEIFLGSKLA